MAVVSARGLDRPEAGTVEIAGEPVTGAGERRLSELRRREARRFVAR